MSDSVTQKTSLYERIGGNNALVAAIEIFYGKIMADPSVAYFFTGTDMAQQQVKLRGFLAMAFGAPVPYTGKKLSEAHARLVQKGLSQQHFDAVAGHLHSTLTEMQLPEDIIEEVLSIVESTRNDVLNLNTNQNSPEMALGNNFKKGDGNQEIAEQNGNGSSVHNDMNIDFLQVLEGSVYSIVIIDERGTVNFFNQSAEKLWGYRREEVMGQNVKILTPHLVRQEHDMYLDRYNRTGTKNVMNGKREVKALRKDGTEIDIELALSEANANGKRYYTAIIQDISDRKRMEEKAKQDAEELRAQEEELRQNMEEMEATQEEMQRAMAEQKKLIGDLEQSQREIDARMASVDTACIVSEADLKGNIIFANDKLAEISQYTQEEMIGQPHSMFRHPDMPKEVFKEMWSTIGKGKIFRGIIKNKKKDGNPYYVDAVITPVLGANGKPVKYIGIRFDITESTLESQRMKGITDAIDTSYAMIEFDTRGNILTANNNFLQSMGYTSEEIQGRHHRMFVEQSYANSLEYTNFWNDLAAGKAFPGEFKRITRSGQEIWLNATYSPVKDEKGRVVKVIKIANDITRQVTERINMEGLKATVDSSFAFIEFDTKGNILDANNNFISTLGYFSKNDIVGKHHSMFVDEEMRRSNAYAQFWSDLAAGRTQAGDFKRITRQGTEIWIQAAYTPVKDKQGNVIKVIKIASDITAQKIAAQQTEAAANEVNRVITAMASGDLTQKYSIKSEGMLMEMGNSLNTAIGTLNSLLDNILQIANLVASSSEELLTKGEQMKGTTQEVASATQQMAEGAQQQAQQTDEASKLMEEVLKTSAEMTKKADIINSSAEKGQKNATDGLSTIRKVVENMNEIQVSAGQTAQSITILTERSEEIARTLNVITDIASQTNLLALNAAIEAARAGDAGRGFAVVAEEIRKLAEDSRKSAIDIEKVISEVQKDINSAGKAINNMEVNVKSGNSASKDAESVFQVIEKSSADTLSLSKEILDATSTQRDMINTTVKNIEKIVVVSEQTASGTEEIASSTKEFSQGMNEVTSTSRDLADVANQLLENVSKFKLK